jgi:hypothetical protein
MAIVVANVRLWHLTEKPPATQFVAYWTNNGQKAALGLDLSAANDPKRTFARLDLVANSLDERDLNGDRRGGGG